MVQPVFHILSFAQVKPRTLAKMIRKPQQKLLALMREKPSHNPHNIPSFSKEKKGELLDIVNQLAEYWADRDPHGESEL